MANSQPYPQAGPSSIPYHHPNSPYPGADSSYQPLPHYAPGHNPSANLGQPNYVTNRVIPSYPEFVPQQRHFRKPNRNRRFPQHHQQQQHLHYYQSQPIFAPPHPVIDPYHLPSEYFPSHELWTQPPFSPPPQHHAYAYQPSYPPSTLPKQLIIPSYGRPSSPPASLTVLPSAAPDPEVRPLSEPSIVHSQPQETDIVQNNEEIMETSSEKEPIVILPVRRNSQKGIALQLERPRVGKALPVTISHSARPPASFVKLFDFPSIFEQDVIFISTSDVVNNETTSPQTEETISLEPGLASTATPETSTGAETPQIGSPRSSMTSISIVAKVLPDTPEDQLELPSETSILHNNVNFGRAAHSPTLPDSIPVDVTSTPSSVPPPSSSPAIQPSPQPSQPQRKSWASLLRAPGSEKDSVNGLPMSSIQGFSIQATSLQETKPKPTQSQSLVNLLTSPTALSGRLPNIRARGLINLGNMCFANTVLQILTYCPPFHKLFIELQRHHNTKESVSTPLINAT